MVKVLIEINKMERKQNSIKNKYKKMQKLPEAPDRKRGDACTKNQPS